MSGNVESAFQHDDSYLKLCASTFVKRDEYLPIWDPMESYRFPYSEVDCQLPFIIEQGVFFSLFFFSFW